MWEFLQEKLNLDLKMTAIYKKKIKNTPYISSTFFKDNSKLGDVLNFCKKNDILNIELGSNHRYEKNFLTICKKYNLNYIVHNYFPIPKKSFVVNIASLNDKIRKRSISHVKRSIRFTKSINSDLYTFHPGFMEDPKSSNKSSKNYDFIWSKLKKNNYKNVFKQMIISLKEIASYAKKKSVNIAIETEGSFKKKDLLVMQTPKEFIELFKHFKPKDLGINLNIGHLNLASKAFNFSKKNFVKLLKKYIVAVEISHNNGLEDQHLPIKNNQWYLKLLKSNDLKNALKILEFRNASIKQIKKSIKILNN